MLIVGGVLPQSAALLWAQPLLLAACVAIVGVAYSGTPIAGLLSRRPLVWLGRISYSLYLWNPVVLNIARDNAVVALPVALLVAWCSYRWVELPLRRRRGLRVLEALPASSRRRAEVASEV
jgi:peptidoglycan/LPS O-acetylase OafA/YrhL